MKIGYILRKFPVLSETFILNEMLELEKQGHQLVIFSVERPNDPRFHASLADLKAEVVYIPDLLQWKSLRRHQKMAKRRFNERYRALRNEAIREFNPTLYFRLIQSCYVANHARKLGIEHFHAHFATRATTVAYFVSQLLDCPYTFTAHAVDIFKKSISRRALQKKMDGAKRVVTVSDYNCCYLSEIGLRGNLVKISNGIDMERFQPSKFEAPQPLTFLCVARFVEKKGHTILIEACRRLKEKGAVFRCLLAGKGKLQESIKRAIRENQLEDVVELLGPLTQKEILQRYHQSHVFVLPCVEGSDGNKDGLPVSIVEALACGLPVITTPMTGNPEVVKEGENGLLVPFHDAEALAKAMDSLIHDPRFYQQLRKGARPSVAKMFDQTRTALDLAKVFVK
jgi:colanic acid/amylovoran biosynthesis glycosyltransferase